ncbi:MAG: gamma-glutamylcyclotransferase [Rhodospirillaceae bacterium]
MAFVQEKSKEFWVFGYGSLMWRPGFAYQEMSPALLHGYHRSPCIKSYRYRGTPETPGLVLGLERGGSCKGIAFRVAPEDVEAVLVYLEEREMINRVYQEKFLPVRLADGRRVRAHGYVADPRHPQFVGKEREEDKIRMIQQGRGEMGTSVAYLQDTVSHMDALGIRDGFLHRLLDRICEEPPKPGAGGGSGPHQPQSE